MADFSPEALRKSIEQLPPEQGGIGVVVKPGDIGVQGSVSKEIGKGWSVTGAGQWMKEKKDRWAAGWLSWRGK
jgi:hypothetical protein